MLKKLISMLREKKAYKSCEFTSTYELKDGVLCLIQEKFEIK